MARHLHIWRKRFAGFLPALTVIVALSAGESRADWPPTGLLVTLDVVDRSQVVAIPDGVGGMIVVWREIHRGQSDIVAQRYDANGNRLFGTVGARVCAAPGNQLYPAIVADGFGGAFIAWQDLRVNGTTPDIYAQRIRPSGGTNWATDGVAVTGAAGIQQNPVITVDGSGGAIVAWEEYGVGATSDIKVQRISSSGVAMWTANGVVLCGATGSQVGPSLVPSPSGGAIVSWADLRSGTSDIYVGEISSAGNPLGTADGTALCTASGAQDAPRLIPDGEGGAIAAWVDHRPGSTSDIFARRINFTSSESWAAEVALCSAAGSQHSLAMIPDGAAGALVAWADERVSAASDIYVQRISSTGAIQWNADGVAVCAAASAQTQPSLAPDGAGGTIVGWHDERSEADVYAGRLDGSGATLWTPNGIPVCGVSGSQHLPMLVTDGTGGVMAAWEDQRDPMAQSVFAQRVNSAGAALWKVDGVEAVEFPLPSPRDIVSVADGFGGAIVVWTELGWSTVDVYAQRVNAAGNLLWGISGTAVCTSIGDQLSSAVVTDGTGGCIVTWTDYRGATSDIYAQRLSAAGVPQLTLNGIAVCSATGVQGDPRMIADGAGGAIIAWEDSRGVNGSEIFAQRVNSSGAPQWTPNGVALTSVTGDQTDIAITTDNAAGAILAWTDRRNAKRDVYAQRIGSTGVPQWLANGSAIATNTGEHYLPKVVPDGAGGAILAWIDGRNATAPDIYAQHLNGSGFSLWIPHGIAVCTAATSEGTLSMAADGAGGALLKWEEDDSAADTRDIFAQRLAGTGTPLWTANGVALSNGPLDGFSVLADDGAGGGFVAWQSPLPSEISDLYAGRIDASGNLLWGNDGLPVCVQPGSQSRHSIAADGAGGAFLFWKDQRNGATGDGGDLYAARLIGTGPVGVPPKPALAAFALGAAWPNPSRANVELRFAVPERARTSIEVFDMQGRRVRRLLDAELAAGEHAATWDGRDEMGTRAGSGVFFFRVASGGASRVGRIVRLD